jgi:type IV pilus assembly protein PilQ
LFAQVNKATLPSNVAGQGNSRFYDFNFVSTDISAVLQAFAVTAGVDIVPVPEVNGIKVDLKITKKTWQEALDILCETYDLTWIIEDKYVSIQRTSSWQAKQLKNAEKKEQNEQVAPLVRKNFQVRHAKASELVTVLQNMTSPRGRITVVDRNNAIIVYDTEMRIVQMGKALSELDVETQQIVITAKLVVIDSKVARELGVDWSAKAGSGSLTTASKGLPAEGQLYDSRNQIAMQSTPMKGNLTGAGQTITMSLLDNNLGIGIYNLIGDGKGEILASPQISTLDHTEARIFMGDKISLRVIDATGQSSTQLVESGIKLTVTPHITGDNRILMDLKPENNSYSYDDKGQPIISTQEAQTKVVVADGETVVIGGLTNNVETESETGIPFLKDIPIFGYLFKYYKKEVTKKDLIIFVTPRIQRNQFKEIQDLGDAEAVVEPLTNASPALAPVASPAPAAVVVPQASPTPPAGAVPVVPPPAASEPPAEEWK